MLKALIVIYTFLRLSDSSELHCADAENKNDCGESQEYLLSNMKSEFHCTKNNEAVDCPNEAEVLLEVDVLVYTVATEQTNGFDRYLDSASEFNIQPKVLGLGLEWRGGEVKTNPGGGWKLKLLRVALDPFKADDNKLVLFTDAYDVIFTGKLDEIVRRFHKTGARILFGAEPYCWPDASLETKYPKVKEGKRFLNSGMFIGYVPEVLKLLSRKEINDQDDDQLFCTEAYLDEKFREEAQIKLDHTNEIFQNLNGVAGEIEIISKPTKEGDIDKYYIKNVLTQTEPIVIHGNGASKHTLNYLGNYVPNAWNSVEGCRQCKKGLINLEGLPTKDVPVVLIALFIEHNTPFLEEFLNKIHNLEYPKERTHLFIHNAMKFHTDHVNNFTEKHAKEYVTVKQITPEDAIPEWTARDLSLDQCLAKKCDIYFAVDSIAHIDNPYTLKLLIEQNRTVIAPLLTRPGKAWSNFWGALSKDGFYARSNDYMDIVHSEKRGLWNVPFISNAYIINSTLLKSRDRTVINYTKPKVDADMTFCGNLRKIDVFMYVSNRVDFGHLINPDNFDITRTEPEMYQIFDNAQDWEDRYIHIDYPENFNPEKKDLQPCPDVYWFPIVSERFCSSLINMMESFGQWSSGSNNDERLVGGYEAVPTRDIHMNQVGWEPHWLHFLQKYVRPLQEKVFLGYYHDPPKSLMNFVVRYRPDEQPSLRPHHDSSTYTINIALNRRNVDYEGGGCKFIRYNCSVVDTKQGWLLIHPGRLTHFHEGLPVTKGTRYIMISFVDP